MVRTAFIGTPRSIKERVSRRRPGEQRLIEIDVLVERLAVRLERRAHRAEGRQLDRLSGGVDELSDAVDVGEAVLIHVDERRGHVPRAGADPRHSADVARGDLRLLRVAARQARIFGEEEIGEEHDGALVVLGELELDQLLGEDRLHAAHGVVLFGIGAPSMSRPSWASARRRMALIRSRYAG